MSNLNKDAVLEVLGRVQDPDLHKDIVTLGFVTKCEVDGGKVTVVINLTTPACPVKEELKSQAEAEIRTLPGVTDVDIEMTAVVRGQEGTPRVLAKSIQNIIAISSGKGGVGKSTVSVNLACALAQTGAKVGLLDCDIYGPDIPMMMGLNGHPEQTEVDGKPMLTPKMNHGVKTMSVGYLLKEEQPAVWRGPMVHKLIEQFLSDVTWGELDYLLVDMPPGTGDAQLSLAQLVPLTGAVLVTTPQAVATFDVTKAITMFKQVNTEILGLVENMAGQTIEGLVEGAQEGQSVRLCVGGQEETLKIDSEGRFRTVVDLFGRGGGERLAARFDIPMIGQLPIDPSVRVGSDAGMPVVISSPDSPLAQRFKQAAGKLAQRIAVRSFASLPVLD
ncbi:MAG: Mrp/NBP35 family ATP-binding protein [Planctomycetota bacterium]|nr:Mrp/NBP35 family ATP-binding protein [Planctomycetota bacterium]